METDSKLLLFVRLAIRHAAVRHFSEKQYKVEVTGQVASGNSRRVCRAAPSYCADQQNSRRSRDIGKKILRVYIANIALVLQSLAARKQAQRKLHDVSIPYQLCKIKASL